MLEMEKFMESHNVTLLGIHIERELKLNNHVNHNYKKAGKKLNEGVQYSAISQTQTINESLC